jgi:hypothetical protein
MTNFRRTLILAIFALTCICVAAQTPAPVVVELFTSEGCSSCPPADDFLRTLDATQPVTGVRLIVLGEHVDYWDDQGWKDKYSDHNFTVRQQNYADKLKLKSSYTPQMVIDGAVESSGNDRQRASQAFENARTQPKVNLRISSVKLENGVLRAHIESGPVPASADVFVALALDHAESQVLRGENGGHHLEHVAIARTFVKAGKASKGTTFAGDVKLKAHPSDGPYRLIAFMQEPNQGKIVGAAVQSLGTEKPHQGN